MPLENSILICQMGNNVVVQAASQGNVWTGTAAECGFRATFSRHRDRDAMLFGISVLDIALGDMDIPTATAVTTALVAVIVALVTWAQWKTNRARLRHELFERRYVVYEHIAGFIADILISGKVAPGEPEGFSRRTKTAYFVFDCDAEIKRLITEIYRKAVELHALEAMLETLTGDDRKKNVEAQRALKNWFEETLGLLETRFEKYLKLSH